MLGDRQLVGDLEGAAGRVHDLGDEQLTPVQVVPAQPLAHDVDRQHPDADAVARAQPLGHRVERLRPLQREVGGEGLGEIVELGEMVALVVQDSAHTLDRRIAGQALGAVGVGVDQHARLARLARGGVGAIEPLHGGDDGGCVFGGIDQLGARHRRVAEDGVGQHLLEAFDGRAGAILHELARVDAVGVGQPCQHGQGDGSLVALHQVEVGGGDGELGGHTRLGEAALAPQPLQTRACKDFPRGLLGGVAHVNSFTALQKMPVNLTQRDPIASSLSLRFEPLCPI